MQLLNDKIIVLTGGTAGIGLECAKAYLQAGAKLSIISNDQESIEHASSVLPAKDVLFILADVAVESEVSNAIQQTANTFGQINAIHNNAGISSPSKTLCETEVYEWDRLFDVNVRGIYHTTRHGMAHLKKTQGVILNTGSLVGEIGQDIHAAYTATKGAIHALTKSMALDYAGFGIRVNAVAPAGVWTPMLKTWSYQQPDPDSINTYLDSIHALGYCPEGDVVANACVFLLSNMSSFITGCILPVSGGAELGYRQIRAGVAQSKI